MSRIPTQIAAAILAMAVSTADAAEPVARGAAMGDAYPTLAGGVEGLWWNPAVFGTPLIGSVGLGLALQGGNNALKLSDFNAILQNDAAAKKDAVAEVWKKGKWEARIEGAGGFGVTLMGIAFGITPRVLVQALDVCPELAQSFFTPESPAPLSPFVTHHITGDVTRAAYNEMALGYAHDLGSLIPGVSLSAGGAVKYFAGSDYERYATDQYYNPTALVFLASATHERASAGKGFGLDLGVQAKLLGMLKAAIVVRNVAASIKWDGTVESSELSGATFVTRSATGTGNITQKLPSQIQVGASYTIPVVGTSAAAALDVKTNPTETRLKLGAEQSLGILAFRVGYVTAAGPEPGMVTCGLGIGALVASLDLAAGFGAGGKGGMVAASAKVSF